MKKLLFVLILLTCQFGIGQNITNLKDVKPNVDFDNLHIEKIYTDENSTSFVIWIKKSVKAHYHKNHTESLYVIEGSAIMIIGDKEFEIKEGDYFTVPENSHHSVIVKSKIPLKVLSLQAPEFLGEDRYFLED